MKNSYSRYYYMNNDAMNCSLNFLENTNNNMYINNNYNENCSCGFDEVQNVFPENPSLAQSYVPIQIMTETFKPCKGLKCGTISPELVNPYNPGDAMKQIQFLENTNNIGKECNSNGRR